MNQRVRIDVVETVACRNVGSRVGEDGGEIGILAVEVNEISAEMALLQQETGSRKVVDPWSRLLRPGFIAIEPLSKRPKRQPWSFSDQRLMRSEEHTSELQSLRHL